MITDKSKIGDIVYYFMGSPDNLRPSKGTIRSIHKGFISITAITIYAEDNTIHSRNKEYVFTSQKEMREYIIKDYNDKILELEMKKAETLHRVTFFDTFAKKS